MPQVLGITLVAFTLIRLIPGNPANAILGAMARPESILALEQRMGLDKPIYVQYFIYLKNFLQADLGTSRLTSQPVLHDIMTRFPATLELISLSLGIAIIIFVPLGVYTAMKSRGIVNRGSTVYALLAGSIPEFWLGLLLVYIFFYKLGWAPAPLGRLGIENINMTQITGFMLIDSLLNGRLDVFFRAAWYLMLPVATLTFVVGGPILKMTRSSTLNVLNSGYIRYGHALGLRKNLIRRYALRNALPPIITLAGILYGFLLGGAVLVETVFSWGGIGQYAVMAVASSDYAALQGFVVVAAVFSLLVYLGIDLLYFVIDPRIEF